MLFAFSDDQRAFAHALTDVLATSCTPAMLRAEADTDAPRAPDRWRALAELGIVGMTAPAGDGGLGMDAIDLILPLEASGKALLPEALVETTAIAIPVLCDAPDEARARWLGSVARGEARAAVGLDGFVLDADVADVLLLGDGDAIHAIERGAVEVRRVHSIDATRRLFDVTWTPSRATIVSHDAVGARARGTLGTAAQLLGIADQLIAMGADYAKQRTQFGVPIGSFQAVKHHLATALMRLEFARPVVYRAAYTLARGGASRDRDVSMAKAFASDAATLAARVSLQVHGAIGYTQESDLHLWLARAWALANAWGDAAAHRARVGDAIL